MDDAAIGWARDTLPGAVITPVRNRPWSDLADVLLPGRRWWFKINKAETIYETPLLGLLAGLRHPLIPELIIHPDRPWSLIADAGRRLDHLGWSPARQFSVWERVLPQYAELQQAVDVDQLLAVGVPDFRPQTLPAWHAELIELFETDPAARARLTAAEFARLAELGPWIEELAAELAAGPPATLQHDDLHAGNVLLAGGRLTVIDWGDSVIGHPFQTLRVTLSRLQRQLDLAPDHPELARLTDAYLEQWTGRGWSAAELSRQADIGYRLAALNRVFANYRAFARLEPAISPDQPGDGLFWIQELIKDAARPPAPRRAGLPDRSARGA